ncbi:DMT family transporter [Nitrincola iocasae]|uniref:DMT family transporter n=1 Tax=Nitrincola iocasae TaxID=2614693 RepID=A0A5J6LGG3_9GAMM|nr:DMT family transporter [Nitrincola iocasae]QEW07677.1 DMT family transporter [Nitrincola iocasae]
MQIKTEHLAYLLLATTTLFWGGNFIVGRAVSTDIPPIALAWWRWLFALLVILPFTAKSLWQLRHRIRKHWLFLTGISILGITNFNTFVYLGLQTSTATDAVLLLSATPVIILLFSRLLFKEPISSRQLIGIALSLSGVLVIITGGVPTHIAAVFQGAMSSLWILAAVISWSFYSVLLRKRSADISGQAFFAITVIIGWLIITPFYLYEHHLMEKPLLFTMSALFSIVYVGLFASVFAFLFWNRGVEILGPNRAGNFIHLIPVWALLLASLILGENMYWFHWLGILLIFSGIGLASLKRSKQATVAAR